MMLLLLIDMLPLTIRTQGTNINDVAHRPEGEELPMVAPHTANRPPPVTDQRIAHEPTADPSHGGTTTDPAHVLSQAASENFPVASRFLPKASRGHLMAVYGFARLVDDIGDEAAGNRLELLDWLEDELRLAARGQATHPLMQRLSTTLIELDLPLAPFEDLIEANRHDQTVHRYERFDDLVGYCRLSAAPVGRLVLLVLGESNAYRLALADDVCIGLQVVEHLQDVAEDLQQDRIYLPLDDLRRLGCDEGDLAASQASPKVRRLIALECGRARRLLASGVPLAADLPLRPKLAVAGFVAGGIAALDAIEQNGFDVLSRPCRPRPLRFGLRLVALLTSSTLANPRPPRPVPGHSPS